MTVVVSTDQRTRVLAVHPLLVKAGLTGVELQDIDPDHPVIDPRSGSPSPGVLVLREAVSQGRSGKR